MTKLDRFLALIDDWKRGDLDAVAARLHPHVAGGQDRGAARLHPDVVWHFSATTKPPARGREESIGFLKVYGSVCATSRLRLFSHAETEDRLFYEATEDFDTPDGHHVLVPYAGILDFKDDLIIGWRDYFDRGLIDGQVAGERELPGYARDIIERPTL